jgi:Tol biopolymer transport system component
MQFPKYPLRNLALCLTLLIFPLMLSACGMDGVRLRMPNLPFTGRSQAGPGLIAYVGLDGNIYTIERDGENQTPVTTDAANLFGGDALRFYEFPTWSRQDMRLAFIEMTGDAAGLEAVNVYVTGPYQADALQIFSSGNDLAFYLYWSPDGERLSFLTSSPDTNILDLWLASIENGETRVIERGAPIFMAWSPDSQTILTHFERSGDPTRDTDRILALIHLHIGSTEALNFTTGWFHAPAWSPSGDRLAATVESPTGASFLLASGPYGDELGMLAPVEGLAAFGWSNDERHLAYIDYEVNLGSQSSIGHLFILDPGDPDQARRLSSSAAAFFWSPDGRQIAYFEPSGRLSMSNGREQVLFDLTVYDLAEGQSNQVIQFIPTDQFRALIALFDQYQHSATIWSPDGRNLVLAAIDDQGDNGIYVVDTAREAEPRLVAPGRIAFWSWE